MTLKPGQILSHYRLAEKLGEGGMGVVWKAEDTKLGRAVAIKVLPGAVADDPQRLARFEREARVLAALSHQNIAAIHQVEEVEGCHFLAMELAEGEDLSHHIGRSPLPPDEALAVALQILEALEAAHAKGIVHRDLKPANIMLSPGGGVKVLDFGLAKAWNPDGTDSSADLSMSPTVTANMTQAGVILGTAAYMSPEQARGKPLDQRGDLWAFGCVLYEMLTGRVAFGGETVTDILGAIVHKEPDWEALPPAAPPQVRRVLERCLTKDPRQRFHAAGDVRIALTEELSAGASGAAAPTGERSGFSPVAWAILAGTTLVLGLLVGRFLWPPEAAAGGETRRFSLRVESIGSDTHSVALLPDGRGIVYPGGDPSMLYLRHPDRFESVALAGTEGASSAILSPDGQWVAFTTGTEIRKIRLDGSPPVTLHDFSPVTVKSSGGAWSPDGDIYMSLWLGLDYSVLYRVPASGGLPEVLIPREGRDGVPVERLQPQLMPGGRRLLYTAIPGNNIFSAPNAEVHVWDLDTATETVLLEHAGSGRYLDSGHLLAARSEDQFALTPMDPAALELTGPAVPLPRVMATRWAGSFSLFQSTPDGRAVFLPAEERKGDELQWIGLDGSRTTIAGDLKGASYPVLSPDGTRIALVTEGTVAGRLRLYDLERQSLTAPATGDLLVASPLWSPDGRELYFQGKRDGEIGLYRMPADGSAAPVRIADPRTIWFYPFSVSPDGRYVASSIWDPDTETDWSLWIIPTDGSTPPFGFQEEGANEQWPQFSGNGRWLAFTSDRTGINQVYIKRFPEEGGIYQVSADGGSVPIWTPDGEALLFLSRDRSQLMGVTVEQSDPPRISRPDTVMRLSANLTHDDWRPIGNMDPGGRRLLMVHRAIRTANHLSVIENWFPELRELAPPGP